MEFNGTFGCNGKVNCNDWQLSKTSFVLRGELENVTCRTRNYRLSGTNIKLFDNVLPASIGILQLSHLAACMEMQLKILNRHETYDRVGFASRNDEKDFYEIRKSVCDFVYYIRAYLFSLEQQCYEARESFRELETELDETLIALRRFFARLRIIPDSTFHYAASNLGNKCTQPEFHMYHMHLELRWFFLTIINARAMYSQSSDIRFDDLSDTLQLVIDDLVYISLKMFERITLTDMRLRTPYSCTCNRELWLMIQYFLEDVALRTKCKTFWEYVNSSLNEILSVNGAPQDKKIFWHSPDEKEFPRSKNRQLFCAWLIYNLALLHGYDRDGFYVGNISARIEPNYEEIDKILKTYVKKDGIEGDRDELDDELRIMIPMLRILVDEWWPARVQVINFLWDCFHRRLEQPFLLQTSGPWSISIEKKNPADILKQIRERIDGSVDQSKESSYGMFLRFLGMLFIELKKVEVQLFDQYDHNFMRTFLKKMYDKNDPRHWNQIKGRIYSKFSKNKVREFNEAGLYNFISLFLTLAVTADMTNVCTVMLDLLPPIQDLNNENGKRYNLSWKGKLAVLLLYNENSMNLESISSNFTNAVGVISCRKDENSRLMMMSFIETLGRIIYTSEKFENGEYIFIGGWIDRYLQECPKNRIEPLIKILLGIFKKCESLESLRNDSGVFKLIDALWAFVASRVRQLIFEPPITGDNYVDLARLAVAFTVEAVKNPAIAKRHKHSAASLFQHFTSSVIVKDVRITKSYLVAILRNDNIIEDLKAEGKNFDLTIIQAWIKCCVLGQDKSEDDDMKFLKNRISSIPEMRKLFANQAEILQFEESEESIFVFFASLAKLRNSLQTEQERNFLDSRVRLYFNNIDKWALASITEETKDTDHAFWVYRCVGTLILCCSPMLYVRNQSNNALRLLVKRFVLPIDQSPQMFLKHLGKRIFSMILLGIETLGARSDLSLQALIRDLFETYLPLLVTENSGNFKIAESLLRCFADAKNDFASLIFEILAASFVIVFGDNSTHKHCYLVMLLLRNLLKSGKTYGNHVIDSISNIFVTNVVSCYFKVHNLHPHRQQTLDFISDFTTNPYYREDSLLREKFKNAVVTVILKFVTFNAQCTFDFLRSMTKINRDIVDTALPQIEKIVVELEKSRRPNAASLRYSLSQFRNVLSK